jgi:hypothetical protein
MFHRMVALSALAASTLLLGTAAQATTVTYDFDSVSGSATPTTLQGATFSSPSDPGAFTFGPNGGLYSTLGATVLSSAGVAATLDISFSQAQTGISFDAANGDGFAMNGNDTLTFTTNTGFTETINLAIPSGSGDFYPQGFFSLAAGAPFTSVAISTSDSLGPESLAVADMTSTPVPLPAALLLFTSGLAGLGLFPGLGVFRRARAA